MSSWHTVDERPRISAEAQAAPRQLAKARKYAACAELFRRDASSHPAAIRALLTPCAVSGGCLSLPEVVVRTGAEALLWFDENPARNAVCAESTRLYGGRDWTGTMPLIPPCACSYLSEEFDGTVSDVLVEYERAEFTPRTEGGRCPAHISNELDFMAHRLRASAAGDADALRVSRGFMLDHLFPWGVVFAAATYARAATPPLRFAGAVLEQLLFCERDHATTLDNAYRTLRPGLLS